MGKRGGNDKDLSKKAVAATPQMDMFQLTDPTESDFSNTIELYDALPKYVWEAKREHADLSSAIIHRQYVARGVKYSVRIKPAIIEKKDGKSVLIYCGQREELVEDALRKLAVNGSARQIDQEAGVIFTLYELQRELKRTGHTFSIVEIKEALEVLRSATLECIREGQDEQDMYAGTFLSSMALTTRRQWVEKGDDAKCYCTFHPMVTQSIMNQTFRMYDYRIAMAIRSPLARYIYKRMSHYWTQASLDHPYTPKLVTFLEQSPRTLSGRMSENIRAMKNALETLKRHKVVSHYDDEPVKDGRFVADVFYKIYPHEDFVKIIKRSNAKRKSTELAAMKHEVKKSGS